MKTTIEWIAVNDRVPEINVDVLVATHYGEVFRSWIDKNGWWNYDSDFPSDTTIYWWAEMPKTPAKEKRAVL